MFLLYNKHALSGFIFICPFLIQLSFVVLHGIVFVSFIKAIKYTALYHILILNVFASNQSW